MGLPLGLCPFGRHLQRAATRRVFVAGRPVISSEATLRRCQAGICLKGRIRVHPDVGPSRRYLQNRIINRTEGRNR